MFLRSAILLLSLVFLRISVGFIVAMRIVTNKDIFVIIVHFFYKGKIEKNARL
jgi:hypothetical protein